MLLGLVAGVALGCATAPDEPRPAGPVSSPPHPTPSKEPHEPDSVDHVGRWGSPEPPPLQAWQPVPLPFDPDAVLVMPLELGFAVALFADERQAVRRHIADVLAANGHPLAPLDELVQIEAAAAEGRLVLESDRQCVTPLMPDEVVARYFTSQPRASSTANCSIECQLEVGVRDPRDEDTDVQYQSPKIRNEHDPRAWTRARLRRVEKVWGGLVGGVISASLTPPIEFSEPQFIGPWSGGLGDQLRQAERNTARCAHDDPLVEIEYGIQLAVGRDGAVERCEAASDSGMARSMHLQCLCQGLEPIAFDPGAKGRRLWIDAIDRDEGRFHRSAIESLQPGTEPWIERLRDAEVLRNCDPHLPSPSDLDATAVLKLSPQGAVEDVQIFGSIDTPELMRFSGCLVRRMKEVPMPCAPPGIDALQVRVAALGPDGTVGPLRR